MLLPDHPADGLNCFQVKHGYCVDDYMPEIIFRQPFFNVDGKKILLFEITTPGMKHHQWIVCTPVKYFRLFLRGFGGVMQQPLILSERGFSRSCRVSSTKTSLGLPARREKRWIKGDKISTERFSSRRYRKPRDSFRT